MRLYMTIHADHEGGNASAHTMHLIGSTLADPYLSFSGAMGSLAGPLHGLANQEVIKWIIEMLKELGTNDPTSLQIGQYVQDTLAAGKVIPGYGHAVLAPARPPLPGTESICGTQYQKRRICQCGLENIRSGATHPAKPGQGKKPLAERGCPLRCAVGALWPDRVQFLHGAVRRFQGLGCTGRYLLVTCAWPADRAAKVGEPEMGEGVFEREGLRGV